MKLLHEYQNGNYTVKIYDDGTKIKETNDDEFIADFPESIDLKITNYCDLGCAYCHENSTTDGKHGDITLPFLKTLRKGTEVAIGGGNPLAHPQLIKLLTQLKKQGVVSSITINQNHCWRYMDLIKQIIKDKLVYGVGISYNENAYDFHNIWKELDFNENVVLHVINGIVDVIDLHYMSRWNHIPKILILGYKDIRKGKIYLNNNQVEVVRNQRALKENLKGVLKNFPVVSFDNLALVQLDVKNVVPKDEWNTHFMGDDGTHTMYVDMVLQEYSVSSTSPTRFELTNNIDFMFNDVKSYKNGLDNFLNGMM